MTDTPRKTLSLKKKRIIRRDDLPRAKPAKPFNKPAQAKKKRPQRPNKPKPAFSPSELRAKELNDRLNAFPVWLEFKPLAIGVDKEIFRLVNDERFPGGSKKVVQKVLRMHTGHGRYLQALVQGGKRFHLDGVSNGQVDNDQQQLASERLASRQRPPN